MCEGPRPAVRACAVCAGKGLAIVATALIPPHRPSSQARRTASSMSDTERKLNAKLLREAEAAAAGGTIRAFRSP